jgi:hypothetical protein
MIDQLGALLSKYEVPIGLVNKLMMLSEFASLEFIIDDSGRYVFHIHRFQPLGTIVIPLFYNLISFLVTV